MKKKLLALAIAGLAASYASAEVKVYGQIDVSMNQYEDTDGTRNPATLEQTTKDDWELESNASRIGFKADYAITEDLRAIAKMEYEVFVDDGNDGSSSDELKQRNIYAGLQSQLGSIIAGKHDTLVKLSQGKVDRFNDSAADMKAVMVGENRQDNIVIISTNEKTLNGFQFSASFMPGEDKDITTANGVDTRESLADGMGFSATYTDKVFYFAAAIDKDVTPEDVSNPTDITRLVADIKVADGFKVGALWQTAEEAETGLGIAKINEPLKFIGGDGKFEEQEAMLVSAEWEFIDKWTAKIQFASSESDPTDLYNTASVDESTNDTYDSELLALGIDYQIASEKNAEAKVYAYIADINTDKQQSTVIGSSIKAQYDDSEKQVFAVGYQLKF